MSTKARPKSRNFFGKRELEQNVWEAALDRIRHVYDLFDHVFVSFSGGKDSTVCLNATLVVAEERGRLPLRAVFYDEEAIPYETEAYCRRVSEDPRVQLEWYCLPVQHRNACSHEEPFWWPWAPEAEDRWVRPMPPEALTELAGFTYEPPEKRPSIPQCAELLAPPSMGSVGMILGIRADESTSRRRAVTRRREENWMPLELHGPNVRTCQPPGTLVSTVWSEGTGPRTATWLTKPIERVRVGDIVASYRTRRSNFVRNGRRVTGVHRTGFAGDLVRVQAGDAVTRYTPDHRCIVGRLGRAFEGHHIYLMRRGQSFRIGRTVAWQRNTSGIAARGKTEGADAVWVLGRFDSAAEASAEESYLQWAWGIPGQTFRATHGLTQEALDQFWSRIGDLTHAAKAILEAHGRDVRLPLWEPHVVYFSRHRGTEVRAANLMDGMEFVTDERAGWRESVVRRPITVSRERYEGEVYSLGVEGDETYVADGLVTHNCYPIYDWSTQDVWTAPARFGWDTNEAYDVMEMVGMSHHAQRCAPPYGEEPMRGLWTFKECFPDIWERMLDRVPGAATAARWATTDLYSFGSVPEKPEGKTWEEFLQERIQAHDPDVAARVAHSIRIYIKGHYRKTSDPILFHTHPLTGISWRYLLKIADRGDFKNRSLPPFPRRPEDVPAVQAAYDAERAELSQ